MQNLDNNGSKLDDVPEKSTPGVSEESTPAVVISHGIAKKTASSVYKNNVCNMEIGNLSLGKIINGFSDDLVETRPFDGVSKKIDISF